MRNTKLRITNYGLLAFAFVFVLAGLFYQTAFAQEEISDDEVNAIAKDLYCPVCENTPLDVCPTEACRQWRELIRLQLSEGKSEAEIKQYFVENYGARVLSEPPRTGLHWLVYILPPVMILAGAVMLFRSFRAWTKPRAAAAGAGGDEADAEASDSELDEYVTRFEEELKKRK